MNNNTLTLVNAIKSYYLINRRSLPWRKNPGVLQDPYLTLISEIMLQQTRASKVKEYYNKFKLRWPTIQDLANADIDEVLTLWSGLGYYSRARNLHATALIVKKKYNGIIPNEVEKLLKLPGIGEYTASAIASIAYGIPYAAIDINIERILSRVNGILSTSTKTNINEVKAFAKKIFPLKNTGDFAQSLMDIGSTFCTSRNPKCNICPLRWHCTAKAKFLTKIIPFKKKAAEKRKKYNIVFYIKDKNNKILFRKRPMSGFLGGMLELPTTDWKCEWPNKNDVVYSQPAKLKWENKDKVIINKFSHFTLYTKIKYSKSKLENYSSGIWISYSDLKYNSLPTMTKKIVNSLELL